MTRTSLGLINHPIGIGLETSWRRHSLPLLVWVHNTRRLPWQWWQSRLPAQQRRRHRRRQVLPSPTANRHLLPDNRHPKKALHRTPITENE